jgi:hypothetical protein
MTERRLIISKAHSRESREEQGREGKEMKGESETIANQEYFSVPHLIDGNTIGVVYLNVVLIMVDTSLTRLH